MSLSILVIVSLSEHLNAPAAFIIKVGEGQLKVITRILKKHFQCIKTFDRILGSNFTFKLFMAVLHSDLDIWSKFWQEEDTNTQMATFLSPKFLKLNSGENINSSQIFRGWYKFAKRHCGFVCELLKILLTWYQWTWDNILHCLWERNLTLMEN